MNVRHLPMLLQDDPEMCLSSQTGAERVIYAQCADSGNRLDDAGLHAD